ncbi:MAG: T9SS type A sorting domain-containing protein, partial [Sphingobacteriales bacterium]
NLDGVNPPFTIDNIVFSAAGLNVASTVDADTTFSHFTGQSVQYYSFNNTASRILATVSNPNQDLGCVTASLASVGNGFTVLNTTGGSYARSNKVILLSPATANTTATYQATFYFTTAELAMWGVDAPNLKLMKVASGVNLSSTINAAQIVTPVFNDQRSTRGYASYTGSFTGGFSQFMLVSAATALPVTSLSFESKANAKNILLQWSTSMEINNKGFVIERSTDGLRFETIGWKDGSINTNSARTYSFADNFVQPNQLYYYRLRQTDLDGRENLSPIKQARIVDKTSLLITISPNPASQQVKIFTAGAIGWSNINLLDAKGSLVQSWKQINCSVAPQSLDISRIPAGVYLIQVQTGDVL